MEALQRWIRHSSPLVKATMGIAVMTGLVLSHRMYYVPYVKRKKLERAEEWANVILEQEEKNQEYENL